MPDRVKEAIFNILGTRFDSPGALPPLAVVDLFAGSGALGLEALSRGAAQCRFVENDRGALAVLKRNLTTLGVGSEAAIVARNAWNDATTADGDTPVDLIFLDPPYRDSEDSSASGHVSRFLTGLGQNDTGEPLVVLHHHVNVRYPDDVAVGWTVAHTRSFGTNSVTLFER